jgi:hypothetical protein
MVMGSWRDHAQLWTTVRERDAPEHNILLTRIFDRRGARIPSLLSFGDTRGARQSKDNDERDIVSNADARQ